MYSSKLLHGFVKVATWICLSSSWICKNCYLDLLRFLHGFVKDVLCISRPLPNKTKLKLDQDFSTCWSFCFELKVFNGSRYSMPRVRCVFGNVFTFETHSGSYLDESHLWNHDVQAHHRCRHDLDHHHQQSVWKCNSPPGPFLCQMLAPSSPMKTNWGRRQIQIYQEEKSEKFKGKLDFKARGKPVLRILYVEVDFCQIAFHSTPPPTIISRWPGSHSWSITIISSLHQI